MQQLPDGTLGVVLPVPYVEIIQVLARKAKEGDVQASKELRAWKAEHPKVDEHVDLEQQPAVVRDRLLRRLLAELAEEGLDEEGRPASHFWSICIDLDRPTRTTARRRVPRAAHGKGRCLDEANVLSSVAAVAVAVLLAGCGGGGTATNSAGPRSPSGHDQQIVNNVVQKTGTLFEEAIPLYACGSDCKKLALRHLRAHAHLISNQTADHAAAVDALCLRRAMTTLSASLGAVEAYADASLARSDAEALTALGRSDDLRLRAKGDCLGVVM